MPLYFITGNKGKFEEIKSVIAEIEQMEILLPEIQEINSEKIIKVKLDEARRHHSGEFIVEDTSLSMECLNGLPGPLIKWFLETIGNSGLSNIAEKLGNNNAQAKTIIGYAKSDKKIYFFEGTIRGKIVSPRGDNGFVWDNIFQPEGQEKTFAQLTKDEKNVIRMRRQAINKLQKFLR